MRALENQDYEGGLEKKYNRHSDSCISKKREVAKL